MHRLIALLVFVTCFFALSFAQRDLEPILDPQAKSILEKIRKKYDGKSLKVDFSIEFEVPTEAAQKRFGSITQKGDAYRIDMKDQSIISNGKLLWVYSKADNLVQINNIEEDLGSSLSPKDILRIYERNDFEFVLTNQYRDGKKMIQEIDLKPNDEYSDYFKIKMAVDKKTSEVQSIKIFHKDGVRSTFRIEKLSMNQSFSKDLFEFKAANFPGVVVEDLRID